MDATLFWNAATAVSTFAAAVVALGIAVADQRRIAATERASARLAAIGIEPKLKAIREDIRAGYASVDREDVPENKLVFGLHPVTKAILEDDVRSGPRYAMLQQMRVIIRRCDGLIVPTEIEKIAALPKNCAANIMKARVLMMEADEEIVDALNEERPIPQIRHLKDVKKVLAEIAKLVTSAAETCTYEINELTKPRGRWSRLRGVDHATSAGESTERATATGRTQTGVAES
ncbi:hypothetical protein [Burkholderia sp. MSMB0856]|uniref:hypothetical protein n=1 Tax=Burkholderia sp. MSMB0856 TaxID=1637869 RepID=UPI00131F0999|nr:hypothetical protein [Burkholderia sp. MSMB0856]